MIISIILNVIYYFIYFIFSPLAFAPIASFSPAFDTSFSNSLGYLTPLNAVIPLETIFLLISISMGIEIAYWSYKGIMWIVKRIKG